MIINSIKVFKNSEKFFVFKQKLKANNFCVYKIAHKKPVKIFREVKLLKKLISSSPILKKRIPNILKYGIIKKGIYKNKGYYVLKFIKGITFTELVQKKSHSRYRFKIVMNFVFKKFIDIIRENKNLIYNKKPTSVIKKLISEELEKIKKKDPVLRVLNLKRIKI